MLNLRDSHVDLLAHFSAQDTQLLQAALAMLPPEDKGYQRPSGEQVALILLGLHVDLSTIIATLLSDPRLTTQLPESLVLKRFGREVMTLVKDVHWLNSVQVYSLAMTERPEQCETLRRMLFSMTHDARAVIIKLAYRVQRLRGLRHESDETQRLIAHETLDIYAPIANRLGFSQLKWELEDLAFRQVNSSMYREIAHTLAVNRRQRQTCIDQFLTELQQRLQAVGINAKLSGRPKHIYSIWKKMQKKQLAMADLYDLLAVRVIVDNQDACYNSLGVILAHWQLVPTQFDDYIINPKENGYQSLHAVVRDLQGNPIEVQIRTEAMDEFAEFGVAAHWHYKEGGDYHAATEKHITSIRQLLSRKKTPVQGPVAQNFRINLYHDRVYVLTPAGKLLDLIKGATPLDFAYAVHTEIGHSCRGAKVNGRIVNLTYQLQSGDQIEILTTKQGEPNRNWLDTNLGYLRSSRTISKIKNWFKRRALEQPLTVAQDKAFYELDRHPIDTPPPPIKLLQKPLDVNATILVAGISNVKTSLAQCCHPEVGDAIGGFISHTHGITIHRHDCVNYLQHLTQHPEQIVSVDWQAVPTSNQISVKRKR